MKYNALIIEDDIEIAHIISLNLAHMETQSTLAYTGDEGLSKLEKDTFDLVILDLMLPGKSGDEIIKELKNKTEAKIVVVSAKSEVNDKVNLLLSGADDYIIKPFAKEEFRARIQVQLRNLNKRITNQKLKWKALELDKSKRSVTFNQTQIALTNTEFDILALLIASPETPFTKRQIYEVIQGVYLGDDNTVNVHVSNLRKKLAQHTTDTYIKTVWGIGFMLV
ncbi:response regulator transcription factor [Staphylococcus ratti]|uniref:Response regulator SaeR n=1 Tax=Staphylococcus ratti TaxID=2892440 RepID=A0ABY3PD75_9STAP|nr:response regulator transcription factor [Staphylococcus ratti]UEX90193.1 response regulator transcription factor [Staphylococcus ratti]